MIFKKNKLKKAVDGNDSIKTKIKGVEELIEDKLPSKKQRLLRRLGALVLAGALALSPLSKNIYSKNVGENKQLKVNYKVYTDKDKTKAPVLTYPVAIRQVRNGRFVGASGVKLGGIKETKITKEKFEGLWNILVKDYEKFKLNEDEKKRIFYKFTKTEDTDLDVYTVNLYAFKESMNEWFLKNNGEDVFLHIYPAIDYDIGDSQWSVAVSPSMIALIKKIKNKKYIISWFKGLEPLDIGKAILDEKLSMYIFRNKNLDSRNDFVLMRAKDAYDYNLGGQEKFEMYIAISQLTCIRLWMTIPTDYEVVGFTPDIAKDVVTLPDNTKDTIYSRGLLLALRNKDDPNKRFIFYSCLIIGDRGLVTSFRIFKTFDGEV